MPSVRLSWENNTKYKPNVNCLQIEYYFLMIENEIPNSWIQKISYNFTVYVFGVFDSFYQDEKKLLQECFPTLNIAASDAAIVW